VWTNDGIELSTLEGHGGTVRWCAFSHDDYQMVSCSWDRTLRLWKVGTWELMNTLVGHRGIVHCCSISNDGLMIASGSEDSTVKIWGARQGIEVKTLQGHSMNVRTCAFSPTAPLLASAGNDGSIKIWSTKQWKEVSTLSGHSGGIVSVNWANNGASLLSCSEDGTVKVWDTAKWGAGAGTGPLYSHNVEDLDLTGASFFGDGAFFATSSNDKVLKVHQSEDNKLRSKFFGLGPMKCIDTWEDRISSGDTEGRVYLLQSHSLINK